MRLYDDKLSYPLIVRHQRDLYLFGVFYMIVNALQDEPKVFVFQIDCLRKSILHDQDLVNDVYTKYICCDYLWYLCQNPLTLVVIKGKTKILTVFDSDSCYTWFI